MKKNLSLTKKLPQIETTNSTELTIIPTNTPLTIDNDTGNIIPNDPNEGTILEGSTGETDNTPPQEPTEKKEIRTIEMMGNNGKFLIIHPDDLEPDTDKTPISKRMGELLLIQMDPETRTSGDHPTIKKHPKWMINPKLNGKERWMDLPKEKGWNLEKNLIILTRTQTTYKEMTGKIIGRIQIIEG